MSTEEQTLLEIKDAINGLPPSERILIGEAARKMRILVWQNKPGIGNMAIALVGAEIATTPDGELPSPEESSFEHRDDYQPQHIIP